jgi:integrase
LQEQLFYAVLAGTGLRISEAVAIRVGGNDAHTHWSESEAMIKVRTSFYRAKEQSTLKSKAGRRDVDLCQKLNQLIIQFVVANKIKPGAFLFQSRVGTILNLQSAGNHLRKHGIAGFHSFRRFRITYLRETGVPEELIRFAVGHLVEMARLGVC